MEVHVHDNYWIKSDAMNNTLVERTGKFTVINKGKPDEKKIPTEKVIGHYGSVAGALKKFVSLKVADSPAKDIKTLIKDIEAIHKLIDDKVRA